MFWTIELGEVISAQLSFNIPIKIYRFWKTGRNIGAGGTLYSQSSHVGSKGLTWQQQQG